MIERFSDGIGLGKRVPHTLLAQAVFTSGRLKAAFLTTLEYITQSLKNDLIRLFLMRNKLKQSTAKHFADIARATAEALLESGFCPWHDGY